jgi:Domain of unknown function (DUF4209)
MNVDEIDLTKFRSINEAYEFVDNNFFEFDGNGEIGIFWNRFSSFASSEIEKQKADWEARNFFFEFRGRNIFNYSRSHQEKSNVVRFPNLDKYESDSFTYLIERAENCRAKPLRARFNHLLWIAPKGIKNRKYGIAAIDNYLFSIERYFELFLLDSDSEKALHLTSNYEIICPLVNQVNHGYERLKLLTSNLLSSKGLSFWAKNGILTDMLNYPKIFKIQDFESVLFEVFEYQLSSSEEEVSDHLMISYIPTAIKIARKTRVDEKKWVNELGLFYMRLAESENRHDAQWLKQDYYVSAIEAFEKAKNNVKVREATGLYSALKPKVKLHNIEVPFDKEATDQIKKLQEYTKLQVNGLLKLSTHEIYRGISIGINFPKYTDIVKSAKNGENNFLNLVSTIHFDRNKNIVKKTKEDEDIGQLNLTLSYHINLYLIPFLYELFKNGVKTGKLTSRNFLQFLIDKSWIGKPYQAHDLGGKDELTDWIRLIAPSIIEFFEQMLSYTSSRHYKPNLILCIDSLTIKIEGLVRNFCERANVPVTVLKKKRMQEAYINVLLEDERLKKYFNEDDMFFFNYLFGTSGLNLRNNIAHTFYGHSDYNISTMLLLIAALLRLAKYDYREA